MHHTYTSAIPRHLTRNREPAPATHSVRHPQPSVNKHSLKILNLSQYSLSPSQISLLSKGLKFTPTPKHNLLEIQCNVDQFCRKLRLQEFFHATPPAPNNSLVRNPSHFTPNKQRNSHLDLVISNIENLSAPQQLRSQIPPKRSNLSTNEIIAINTLRNNTNIIIKEADKGGIVVIMDKNYYVHKINSTLSDLNYYQPSNIAEENNTIQLIKTHINSATNLTEQEKDYITNFSPKHSNLYGLPKIHKSKIIQDAISTSPQSQMIEINCPDDLTFRPIVAGPLCPTHRLSNFLHLIFSSLTNLVPSFIKDTTSFLRKLPQTLNTPSYLCTMDIVSLYSNIPHDLGITAITYWINMLPQSHARFPPEFILTCLEIVLKNNIFCFNNLFYKQVKGTAMGTKCAPYYATLTLGYLEKVVIAPIIESRLGTPVKDYFLSNFIRYLDDCFIIWPKSFPPFQDFFTILNQAHPSITYTTDFSEKEIPFLDVLVQIKENNRISTDIYEKPTDSHNYIHFHSSHPPHIKRNIPYTLSRRISTIVNDPLTRQHRLNEMKSILLSKQYPRQLVDNAISKALTSLQQVSTTQRDQPIDITIPLILTFNPNNPNITNQVSQAFHSLKSHNQTRDIYKNSSVQICKRQPPNLKKLITSAKTTTTNATTNNIRTQKCNRHRCKCCEILIEKDEFLFTQVNKTFKIKHNLTCTSKFVIYALVCNKCKEYYIGLTTNYLCSRITLHRQHVNNPSSAPLNVSKHIAQCARELDLKFSVFPFYHVQNHCLTTLRRMESHFIHTLKPRLNSI